MDKAPVFIKIEEYRQVVDLMAQLKDKVQQARELLQKLTNINNQENEQLANWAKDIDDVEQKVTEVDKAIVEPEI